MCFECTGRSASCLVGVPVLFFRQGAEIPAEWLSGSSCSCGSEKKDAATLSFADGGSIGGRRIRFAEARSFLKIYRTMTYPIIPELYGIVARRLLDEIGDKSYYSGSFSFEYGSRECRLAATLIVYRSMERMPEGDVERIDELVPVWWEFHTSDAAGEHPNDFSFSELREYLF